MSKVLVVTEKLYSQAKSTFMDILDSASLPKAKFLELSAPEGKKKPGKADIRDMSEAVEKARKEAKADYVLLAGNLPLQAVTGSAGITKHRGKPIEQKKAIFLPTFSPATIFHDEGNEAIIERDVKTLLDIINFGGIPEERELNVRYVLTMKDFREMKRDLRGTVSFDIETTGLYAWADDAKITQIGFGTKKTQWILPVRHRQSPWSDEVLETMIDELTDILEDCFVVTHNGKFDMLWMRVHFGVEWRIDFDTMLAHFLLDENSIHGLKFLAQKYCGAVDWDLKQGKTGAAPLLKLGKYHAHDLYYTRELRFIFGKLLRKEPDVHRVFKKIMMPCANLFVDVEFNGVCIDHTKFAEAEKFLREQYNTALKDLKKWEPPPRRNERGKLIEFNWGSTQQLSALLFGKPKTGQPYGLGIEPLDKTAAGNPSCSESVIKRIDHPMAGALLKFREAKQQLSFFIDGWKPYLTKRKIKGVTYYFLHPSFKLHGTVTGRLSCENPNLQQVPRDPRIRTLISAMFGWELIEADLSQIELRVAAELAGEEAMIRAFKTNVDVHWLTALREIERGHGLEKLVMSTAMALQKGTNRKINYNQAIEILLKMGPDAAQEINAEWKENRKKAKAINFGYLYGMWWKKFKLYARDNYGVTVTDAEAQASREAFFDLYECFPEWHERQRRYARKHGYVLSLSGRKRRLPAARSNQDTPQRREAERQAINSPVQSFANDINLMALIQLVSEFPRSICRVVGTVHDAILVMVKREYVPQVYKRLLEIMSRPKLFDDFDIEMDVPIEAEAKIGPWGAGKSLEKWLAANQDIPDYQPKKAA